MGDKEEKSLTIFELVGEKERKEAVKNLLSGKTPVKEIKKRPMRGGGEANYVNTYYMTRQISLLTGFRWASECLEEKFLPDENNPRELGAKIKVTIWDGNGTAYSHTSWGQKDVAKYNNDGTGHKKGDPISIFDDLKAAYSDGIKKCLSYFGIANDIYGGKELEFFATDENGEGETTVDFAGDEASKAFGRFLSSKHVAVSKACEILKIKSLTEITNYKEAHDKILKELEK